MLLSAPIHLLESSEQPHRPGRPHQSERLVDVVRDLLRPGRRLVKECDWHLELVGDPGWWGRSGRGSMVGECPGFTPTRAEGTLGHRQFRAVLSPRAGAVAGGRALADAVSPRWIAWPLD